MATHEREHLDAALEIFEAVRPQAGGRVAGGTRETKDGAS
jgi:hypothetical protein